MKKIIFSILFTAALFGSRAQNITGITFNPAYPTIHDTITIYIQCTFPNGSCDGVATYGGMSGNTIYANALHCMGMLSVICDDYDTVVIPPLQAGHYSFVFTLTAGHGTNCSPGIVPDDVDTVHFMVSDLSGIEKPVKKFFQISPNPSGGNFTIKQSTHRESILKIYSSNGRLIYKEKIIGEMNEIDPGLSPGVYNIVLENKLSTETYSLIIR